MASTKVVGSSLGFCSIQRGVERYCDNRVVGGWADESIAEGVGFDT